MTVGRRPPRLVRSPVVHWKSDPMLRSRAPGLAHWLAPMALVSLSVGATDAVPEGQLPDTLAAESFSIELGIDPREDRFDGRSEVIGVLKQATDTLWLHGREQDIARGADSGQRRDLTAEGQRGARLGRAAADRADRDCARPGHRASGLQCAVQPAVGGHLQGGPGRGILRDDPDGAAWGAAGVSRDRRAGLQAALGHHAGRSG